MYNDIYQKHMLYALSFQQTLKINAKKIGEVAVILMGRSCNLRASYTYLYIIYTREQDKTYIRLWYGTGTTVPSIILLLQRRTDIWFASDGGRGGGTRSIIVALRTQFLLIRHMFTPRRWRWRTRIMLQQIIGCPPFRDHSLHQRHVDVNKM